MSLLLLARPAALMRPAYGTSALAIGRSTCVRFNSTTTTTTGQAAAAAAPSLTWNEFLAQRVRRRKLNTRSSIVTGLVGIAAGWAVVANIEIDPTQLIFGFDMLQVLPFGLLLCGGVGALAGPSIGGLVFRASLGKNFASFNQKNAEFLRHVKKMRPDPSKQTLAIPVPDYYGEKIGSLKDYRRWLRDGRAFKRKVETFL